MSKRSKQRGGGPPCRNVLVIEDNDNKYAALREVLVSTIEHSEITRAKNVTEGEDFIRHGKWSLLILDVSMDIRGSSRGAIRGGHANMGGLDIVEGMYLTETVCPTIILTGFDYFQSTASGGRTELIGLGELEAKAKRFLKAEFYGCVRYGAVGWKEKLRAALNLWEGKSK